MNPASSKPDDYRLRMPAEHGAWGILLVPLVTSAGVAGISSDTAIPLSLVIVGMLAIFVLRASVEAAGGWQAIGRPQHLAVALIAAVCAVVLLFIYHRWSLFWLTLPALSGYALQNRIANRHLEDFSRQRASTSAHSYVEKRSLAAELVGVALLTLSAPATWIAMRGALDGRGATIWAMSTAFFVGGVLYVKYRVRGLMAHQEFRSVRQRLVFAWPVFAYHAMLGAMLVSAMVADRLELAVLLAFLPGVLRAMALAGQLGRRFPIKRLGWSEVAHGVMFAVLLILALRN